MARAYSTFATRGRRPEVVAVTEIDGPNGRPIARREPRLVRTIDEDVADVVNAVLQRVMVYGTGRRDAIGRPSAGKTGTADNHQDVWFGGYTPHPGLTAVAWVGYPPDENGRIREMHNLHGRQATGGAFPGRIWQLFMQKALEGMPVLDFAEAEFGGEPVYSYRRCGAPGPSRPGCVSRPGNGQGAKASPRPSPSPRPPEPCAGATCPEEPSPSPSPEPSPKPKHPPGKPSPSPQPSPGG
jgi:membrane peptidoglycan carboxypeptidase